MVPVAIIGAGPVGLTLGLVLARFGIRSVFFEERTEPTPRDESRAITWQPRGIELLDWLGLRERVEAEAVSRTRHIFQHDGRDLLTLKLDAVDSPFAYTLDLPQGDSERIIAAALVETGLAEIRRGHPVHGVRTIGDSVRLEVRPIGGTPYEIDANWVAACDGYHSPTRRLLGIATHHKDYGADSAVADFLSPSMILPAESSTIVLDAQRPYGFFRFGRDRWRLIYRINRGESREEMVRHETVMRLVHERASHAQIDRVLWASAFRLGQNQSAAYRHERVILAGDAAHGMGPSAGAGMQVGALGAWRLGWRLALAASGHPLGERLLDDYGREQRVGSDQVQSDNALIFRNLALAQPALAMLRTRAIGLIGRFPQIVRKMAGSMTLVDQHLPVETAADRPALVPGLAFVSRSGMWRAGRRAPAHYIIGLHSLADPSLPRHIILPISGSSLGSASPRRTTPRANTGARANM